MQKLTSILVSQVGFSIELTHLDGHKFVVDVDGIIECDQVKCIPSK